MVVEQVITMDSLASRVRLLEETMAVLYPDWKEKQDEVDLDVTELNKGVDELNKKMV